MPDRSGVTRTHPFAGIPTDRVVQVVGVDAGQLAGAVAEHSTELAAVVARTSARRATPREFVDAVLDELERVAVEVLPGWLPDAADIDRADAGGTAVIRMIAAARAAQAHYNRSFLRDLTILAVTGNRGGGPGLPARVRAAQLARLVAESFGRTRCVLLVQIPADLTAPERDAMVAGGDWLAHNARLAIWLLGPSSASPSSAGSSPVSAERVPVVRPHDLPSPRVTAVGRPHPASAVEAALEAALAVESWAVGRRWNQTYRSTVLSAPVRLDLVWPREWCVVELDGPEHCHPVHYEADRQRDVQLQLDGYAVLRFTNARVVHDVGAVVHQIGTYIRGRRRDTAKGT